MYKIIRSFLAAFFVLLSLSLAAPGYAHASLIHMDPAGNSTITELPERISLDFDGELIDLGSGYELTVISPNGNQITQGEIKIAGGNISRALQLSDESGTYRVSYRVVSDDGHVVTGEYVFELATPIEPEQVLGSPKSKSPDTKPSEQPVVVSSASPSAVAERSESHEAHASNGSFITIHQTHLIWTIVGVVIVSGLLIYRSLMRKE